MDFATVLGIVSAFGLVFMAIFMGGGIQLFVNVPALMIVVGGTLGLLPSRFSVGGYCPSRPLHSNDNPKDRAVNRRVEIIFQHPREA
jgi:hypothetical protein